MILSHVGILADVLWYEIKNHAKNIELGEYMVMPNHVHGILILNNPDTDNQINNSINVNDNGNCRYKACLVSTTQNDINTKNPNTLIGRDRFQNQGKNTISSIIGGYKSAVTKHARRLGFDFYWQSRFHDHIFATNNLICELLNILVIILLIGVIIFFFIDGKIQFIPYS